MSESGKKRRRSRKTKEEKMMEKIAKEQEELRLKEQAEREEKKRSQQMDGPDQNMLSNLNDYERIKNIISQDNEIFQKMVDTDVRIKYGFIKTLHNNLTSINSRFNWKPEELMAIGSIFRDFQNIEMNVYNTVVQQNNIIMEEEEEEEDEEDEEPEEEVEIEE